MFIFTPNFLCSLRNKFWIKILLDYYTLRFLNFIQNELSEVQINKCLWKALLNSLYTNKHSSPKNSLVVNTNDEDNKNS